MQKSNPSEQIRLGAIISYFAIVISIISAMLYTPWMKNQIGDSNYGLYTLVSSLISIFLMDFGLGTSATRFIAKYRAAHDDKSVNDVLGYIFKLYILIDILIVLTLVIVYFLIDGIYIGLDAEEIYTFKKVYVVFASYSIISFPFTPLSGILNAHEKFVQLKLCDLFQKLFAIFLIVIALTSHYGIVALVFMNAFSGFVTICLKFWIVTRNKMGKPNFKVRNKLLLNGLVSFSVWMTVLAISQRMIFNIAPSVLGVTSNSMEIARFAPASQLEGYFFTFANAINGLFLPTVVRYDQDSNSEKFITLLKKVGRYQICMLGLIFTGLAVLATDFVELWMGKDYRISGICAVLMIFPSLLMYPLQIADTLIAVRNKVKYQALAYLFIGVVNIVLSLVLTPSLGALGSSISIFVAYSINFLFLNIIYRNQLQLNLKSFYFNVYFRYLPIIGVSILLSYFIVKVNSIAGWRGFCIDVVTCVIVYLVLLVVFGLSRNERNKVKNMITNNVLRK
jgi:O-antigen/teichoic acid export membrane protein